MGRLQWYLHRLKAMNVQEMFWRLQQKGLAEAEKRHFGKRKMKVDEKVWNRALDSLEFHPNALGLHLNNAHYTVRTDIHMLQGPDYGRWPDTFSPALEYKQRDDLGDARSCWEKHRHFQYALQAKAFHVTHEEAYLLALQRDLEEWTAENPFLHGIAWVSVMEVAIRAINWIVAMAFCKEGKMVERMRIGVINMIDYIGKHYSRFSSANNHLLVEAAAIGMAGFAFGHEPWKRLGRGILSEELHKQNYEDGVNKEQSLHYQTFGMEAYCLMAHVMQSNGEAVPTDWTDMLSRQGEYVSHAIWRELKAMEFGDDDEGKIIDLHGGIWSHFNYVLQFCSLVTGRRFHTFREVEENIRWLFDDKEVEAIKSLPLYDNAPSRCFAFGGNTFLRDAADRVLIGIDHAALGFGPIAAHGHADALSVQMMVDGETVLADPGTYIYHCDLLMRNAFRRTIHHNTISLINGQGEPVDQSQMLGAFLWGKRAECQLEHWGTEPERDTLTASHDGYSPLIHRRTVEFIGKHSPSPTLHVEDQMSDSQWVATWLLGKNCQVEPKEGGCTILIGNNRVVMDVHTEVEKIVLEKADISEAYGKKEETKAIRIYGCQNKLSTEFRIELNQNRDSNG